MNALFYALLAFVFLLPSGAQTPNKHTWHAATPAQLYAFLPARATVEKERIETEMRTATGLVDERGKMIGAVVLITAGYSADGKYSHYLELQSPMRIAELPLKAGSYVLGWTRGKEGLVVGIYDARTGAAQGTVTARPLTQPMRIESFKIWDPADHRMIQIGRFMLPYSLEE